MNLAQSKIGKCVTCKQPTPNRVGLKFACNIECAIEFTNRARAKKRAQELSHLKKKNRVDRARIETLETLCSRAQRDVNKLVMARDRGMPCISCGSPNIAEAGHYFHAGSKYRCSRFRFFLENITAQCNYCNQHKGGGNQHEYRIGYIARYGEDAFKYLEELKRQADSGELEPLSKDEVRQIAADARRKTRLLLKD